MIKIGKRKPSQNVAVSSILDLVINVLNVLNEINVLTLRKSLLTLKTRVNVNENSPTLIVLNMLNTLTRVDD